MRITAHEKRNAPQLEINPEFFGSHSQSNPFSAGSRMHRYTPLESKTKACSKTARTLEFEQKVYSVWKETNRPVPYLLILPDGALRSLDWGFIGQLSNLSAPELKLHVGSDGYVNSIEPAGALLDRYVAIENRLRAGAKPAAAHSADEALDNSIDIDLLETDERQRFTVRPPKQKRCSRSGNASMCSRHLRCSDSVSRATIAGALLAREATNRTSIFYAAEAAWIPILARLVTLSGGPV
jgi:hypothetical protein